MTTLRAARVNIDLADRKREIGLRLQCAFAAAHFAQNLVGTNSIENLSQAVYDWVTKGDE